MYTLIMAATGTRKAPIVSATLFKPGTTKTGNDGNKWTIIIGDNLIIELPVIPHYPRRKIRKQQLFLKPIDE